MMTVDRLDLPERTEKARAALHWLERHAPTGVGSEHARQLRIVLRELIDAVDQQPQGAVSAHWSDDEIAAMASRVAAFGWPYKQNAAAVVRVILREQERLRLTDRGAV